MVRRCFPERVGGRLLRLSLICLGLIAATAYGADVGLAGLFPGKALLTIDGGPPRIVPVGAKTAEGVKVLSIEGETATLEIDGNKRVLRVGQNVASQGSGAGPAKHPVISSLST